MAWTLFALAQHPDIEARVLEELRAIGLLATPANPNPRDLEYADLASLPYLRAVIKESMRVYTVISPDPRV